MSSLRWHAAWPRTGPRLLVWAVLAVLTALCVWLAIRLLWSLLTRVEPVTASAAPVASQTAAPSLDVARWHLFGNGNRTLVREKLLQAQRETELKLTLHGTFAHANPRTGFALIADKNGIERGYRVGDTVPGGVTLDAVYADHVVLDNHGRAENLRLPRESLHAATSTPAAKAARATGQAPTTTGQRNKPASPIFVAPRMIHGKVDWQAARAQIGAHPQQLLQQLDLQPVFNGSHMRGVRLGAGASSPLMAQAGLQPNDIVTAVNGVPLDSPSRGQQLFEELRNAPSVQLTILRNGQPQTLSVDLHTQP